VLVAIKHRTTLDGSHRLRHANAEHYLKSADEMAELFEDCWHAEDCCHPERSEGSLTRTEPGTAKRSFAIAQDDRPRRPQDDNSKCPSASLRVTKALRNSIAIAERCRFNLLRDLGYEFPHYPVPPGETPDSH